MKTTETVTLPLFFLFLFIWCGGAFFNNVLRRNAMSVFLCSFHQFSMFCLRRNLSPCNFCLLVVQLFMRFCFFRKNFQYAVARCVGYFSTTFCAEMQCRFFFAVFISFQCFICAVIFHRVFCLLVVQLLLRFCSLRKFCVFECKLSGRLSEKVPRQGSLLVSTVCLA